MNRVTGSITLKNEGVFYTLFFHNNGWVAAEMVQHLDQLYGKQGVKAGIVKLLGYTLEVNRAAPSRSAHHWVEVDVEARALATNSDLIRRAVKQEEPAPDAPYLALSLRSIYDVLDALDYTVELYS